MRNLIRNGKLVNEDYVGTLYDILISNDEKKTIGRIDSLNPEERITKHITTVC